MYLKNLMILTSADLSISASCPLGPLCLYVYTCICVYVCSHMCVYVCVCVYIRVSVCMCVCVRM